MYFMNKTNLFKTAMSAKALLILKLSVFKNMKVLRQVFTQLRCVGGYWGGGESEFIES